MQQHLFRLSIIPVLVAGMAVALPALLTAQVPTQVTEGRGCQTRAEVMRTSIPRGTDIESLSPCVISGGPALAALWTRHLTLSAEQRSALRSSSISLRDGQIYHAVRKIAGDPGLPPADRLTALQVLASYFQADLVPSVKDLLDPRYGGPGALPVAVDISRIDGATPLPPRRMSEIPTQLAELAWSDPDPDIRAAALKLRQAFAYRHPDVTPLKPGAITLTAQCGTRVLLSSKADVVVPIVLHLGNSQTHSEALKVASPNGPPSKILLSLSSGPVVATVAGHEVARLTDRNAPCKPGQLP